MLRPDILNVIIVENENFKQHQIGGISSYIRSLVKLYENNNINYSCIGSGFNNSVPDVSDQKLLSVTSSKVSNPVFFLWVFLKKNKLLTSGNNVIIHLHHPYMALAFGGKRKSDRFVLSLHSKQDQSFSAKNNLLFCKIYNWITKRSLKKYHSIIADNNELAQYYQLKYNLNPEKIYIVSTPLDLDVFRPLDKIQIRAKYDLKAEEKLILYAGRIEKEKNLELLLRSYKILCQENEKINLWIVGEGRELINIMDCAMFLELKNIRFIGTVLSSELPELMSCADVFALTSFHEGGPIVVKEALACNLPVVSVDVGDVAEVVKGLDGCYISNYNELAFANSLKMALENKTERNYYKSMQRYGVEAFGERVMEVYNSSLRVP